jgi:hypothetical protein
MTIRCAPPISFVLFALTLNGCSSSTTPPVDEAEAAAAVERSKAEALKKLEGTWLVKSSVQVGDLGVYSLLSSDSEEMMFRIQNGAMEMRMGENPWVKYATLAIGTEPDALLWTKSDVTGQNRIIQSRYKLEGDSLVTVQDTLYPNVLPDSFDLDAGIERQRQMTTYVRAPGAK